MEEFHRQKEEGFSSWNEEPERLRRQIAALKDAERRLVRLYAFGEIDEEYITRETQRLKNQSEVLRHNLEEIERQQTEFERLVSAEARFSDVLETVHANLENLDFGGRCIALDALEVEVWV